MKRRIRLHGSVVPKVPNDKIMMMDEFKYRLSKAIRQRIDKKIEEDEQEKKRMAEAEK